MNNLNRLLLALSLTAATVATAQPAGGPRHGGPGGPGGPGRGPGGHPIVRALDADHNGELSAAELANASAAIRALDANGDGTVTREELRPARPANLPARDGAPSRPTPPADAPARPEGFRPHMVDPIMLALDANQDGALSAAEITNASASLAALDLNKDGKLTGDEFRPLPPKAD